MPTIEAVALELWAAAQVAQNETQDDAVARVQRLLTFKERRHRRIEQDLARNLNHSLAREAKLEKALKRYAACANYAQRILEERA